MMQKKAKKRKIVVGHQPTNLSVIEKVVDNQENVIPLDNGCIYTKPHKIYDFKQMGNLLCLNLDNLELAVINNVDG
jgi:hypothetical protein